MSHKAIFSDTFFMTDFIIFHNKFDKLQINIKILFICKMHLMSFQLNLVFQFLLIYVSANFSAINVRIFSPSYASHQKRKSFY